VRYCTVVFPLSKSPPKRPSRLVQPPLSQGKGIRDDHWTLPIRYIFSSLEVSWIVIPFLLCKFGDFAPSTCPGKWSAGRYYLSLTFFPYSHLVPLFPPVPPSLPFSTFIRVWSAGGTAVTPLFLVSSPPSFFSILLASLPFFSLRF